MDDIEFYFVSILSRAGYMHTGRPGNAYENFWVVPFRFCVSVFFVRFSPVSFFFLHHGTAKQQAKDNIGLAGGGQKVGQCRDKYKAWVENLIKLASLQTSFVTMDEALKVRLR